MSEASVVAGSENGTAAASKPAALATEERKDELARMLYRKVAQGYEVESETDDAAVIVMRGRRKWFGLSNAPSVRHEVTVDEAGRPRSRKV